MTSRETPTAEGGTTGVSEGAVEQGDGDVVDDDQPNYLIRRGIAIGGVVAAIAAGAIVVGSLIDGGDDESPSGAAEAEWDTIVLLDERSGQIIVADEAGEEQSRFASGVSSPTDALTVASTVLVTSTDSASIVDLADESSQTFELALESNGATMPAGSAVTMLTTTALGDRVLLVHGPTGEVLDTDGSTPIAGARFDVSTALAAPSGRDVLITDSGNFQTVLFSFEREEPSFFPGRALAVGDDLVVTTQNVGNEANVTVFAHDGTAVVDARAPSVRAGMIVGGSVILVTVDGEVIELDASDGTTSSVGTMDVGAVQTGHVDTSGTRLIVTGDSGTAVVDESGDVIASIADGVPLATGIDELAPHTSSCIVITTSSGAGPDSEANSGLVIASLEDGSIVAEADVDPPLLSTVDGCTVVGSTESGLAIVDERGVASRATGGELVAVTPDGSGVVTETVAGRLLLTGISDATLDQTGESTPGPSAPDSADDAGAIDLGPASRLVLFTQG